MEIAKWYQRMIRVHLYRIAVGLLALMALLIACTPASSTTGSTPRVFFVEPRDGATVSSPVHVKTGAENFTVESAGEVKEGHGHLHIMIDTDCVPAGQAIPKDDSHLHYGKGQTEANLNLSSGSHRLCLQAADGSHIALQGAGMKDEITITVK